MKPRLFLDEDVHVALALALRRRGYDVVHAQEVGRKGKSDPEQLSYAVEHGRCVFSFNVRDFVVLHNGYARTGQEHCGILVLKQRHCRGDASSVAPRPPEMFSGVPQESVGVRVEGLATRWGMPWSTEG